MAVYAEYYNNNTIMQRAYSLYIKRRYLQFGVALARYLVGARFSISNSIANNLPMCDAMYFTRDNIESDCIQAKLHHLSFSATSNALDNT